MIPPELVKTLLAIRDQRYAGDYTPNQAEVELEDRYQQSEKLAVYGTLAPGESNFHVVQSLGGEWSQGRVQGVRFTLQVGHDVGYPGFRWIPDDPPLPIHLLTSAQLPGDWDRLDRFEGADYCRILVPLEMDKDSYTVANLYECRHQPRSHHE